MKELVRLILMSVDYYSKEEIRQLQKTIEEIEMQNPIETRKVEADNYLRYGRPLEALAVYKKVDLMMEDSEDMVTNEFRGNVCHNMGIAFARLANGEAALACFKKAYEWNASRLPGCLADDVENSRKRGRNASGDESHDSFTGCFRTDQSAP